MGSPFLRYCALKLLAYRSKDRWLHFYPKVNICQPVVSFGGAFLTYNLIPFIPVMARDWIGLSSSSLHTLMHRNVDHSGMLS